MSATAGIAGANLANASKPTVCSTSACQKVSKMVINRAQLAH